jgi:predicted acylesterase/phospholipase RssA
MTIKHLVLSGGGPIMVQLLGAIQQLETKQFMDLKQIESIYSTSAGAIVGVLVSLKYDWVTIYDYIIKRPWQEVFKIKADTIFESYSKKGMFDLKTLEKCFKPLFDAKDIPMDITLEDFYKYSNIEFHVFSFEMNAFKIEDISYLTHPTLTLITALHMTCSLPILVTPVFIDDKLYIDGGIICNYPLQHCIDSGKNSDEILGFKNQYTNDTTIRIQSESTLLDFIMFFLFKIIYSLNTDNLQPLIKHEFLCKTDKMNINMLQTSLSSIEMRKQLFENGIDDAKHFLSKLEDSI